MVWITNPDVGERRKRDQGKEEERGKKEDRNRPAHQNTIKIKDRKMGFFLSSLLLINFDKRSGGWEGAQAYLLSVFEREIKPPKRR